MALPVAPDSSMLVSGTGTGFILAFIAGFLIFFIILVIAAYIYASLALMAIAKRTKTRHAWLAWIPIANMYLMAKIGRQSGWLVFGFLLAFIPIIGIFIGLALSVYLWWKIAEQRNRPGWFGILMLIPIVNFVLMGILAWSKK